MIRINGEFMFKKIIILFTVAFASFSSYAMDQHDDYFKIPTKFGVDQNTLKTVQTTSDSFKTSAAQIADSVNGAAQSLNNASQQLNVATKNLENTATILTSRQANLDITLNANHSLNHALTTVNNTAKDLSAGLQHVANKLDQMKKEISINISGIGTLDAIIKKSSICAVGVACSITGLALIYNGITHLLKSKSDAQQANHQPQNLSDTWSTIKKWTLNKYTAGAATTILGFATTAAGLLMVAKSDALLAKMS